ncbi:MAG: recombinase family protein [Rhizobiales bacterium]|nr:recombinase family protein [Hyphomicrobiales bacterium]
MANGGFVAYYRVSTAKQGASGLGLQAQREAVQHYLNGGRWRIVAEHVEVESGRRSDRPELEKALAAARLHKVPLIVAKLDRLTRSVAFLSRLLEAGVDVRFCDLPQVEGPQGRFLLNSMVAVAELEAGLISQRTKAALAAAKARGTVLGGDRGQRPTRAMRKAAKAAVAERVAGRAADLAPVIEELRTAGVVTLGGIARALTEREVPTARGATTWTAVQVQRVLSVLDRERAAPGH